LVWVPKSRADVARGEVISSALAAAVSAWFVLVSAIDVHAGQGYSLLTALAAAFGALWWGGHALRWRWLQRRCERLQRRDERALFAGLAATHIPFTLPHRATSTLVVLSTASRLLWTRPLLFAAPSVVLAAVVLGLTAIVLYLHHRWISGFERCSRVALSIEPVAPEEGALRCTLFFADKAPEGPLVAEFDLRVFAPAEQPWDASTEPIVASLRDVRRDVDSRTFDVIAPQTMTSVQQSSLHRRAVLSIAASSEDLWLFILDRTLASIVAR
jgi:hypothetical protein